MSKPDPNRNQVAPLMVRMFVPLALYTGASVGLHMVPVGEDAEWVGWLDTGLFYLAIAFVLHASWKLSALRWRA